jgi:DNA-binding LytR/AlgR family response regulator
MRYLTLINDKELYRFPADKIVYASASGNYTDIHTADGGTKTVTMQLNQVATCMEQQLDLEETSFVRVGRSLIINTAYIAYINPTKKQLELNNFNNAKVQESASTEALRELLNLLKDELNTK